MEINIPVLKRDEGSFRTFHEEVGTSKTKDGGSIRILSTVPHRNIIIVYDGIDYEVSSYDILNAVMYKLVNEPKGEE